MRWLVLAIILLLGLQFLPHDGVLAQEGALTPLSHSTFEIQHGLSKTLQGLFGITGLAGWLGSSQIENEIHKKVTGDVHVHIKPFTAVDLLDGKARSIRITGHNILYDDMVYISDLQIQSDPHTPLWVDLHHGKLKYPLDADFSIVFKDTDFNRSVQTPKLVQKLSDLKISLGSMGNQEVSLLNANAAFFPDRVQLKTSLGLVGRPEAEAVPLDMSTAMMLMPDTGFIQLQNINLAALSGVNTMLPLERFLQERFASRPIDPNVLIHRPDIQVMLKTLVITDGQLVVAGHVHLLPTAS